ncbi:MAG TPA: Fic family protein [Thermoanaerobaculia bacterium]|nr:Fic family protein [Thermoanaerobaculia bacterium]
MRSFRDGYLHRLQLPLSSVWLMNDIAEAKGRQHQFLGQPSPILSSLGKTALIQSVESSNRIEGVTVAPGRLEPLVLGEDRPRDRSEEEIRGYRVGLELIRAEAAGLAIDPPLLRRLHAIIQEGAGDAGQWKKVNNDIVELRPGAPPRVRFRTLPAAEAEAAVEEICLSYRHALDQERVPPLLAAAALVFDFLCIHPFRDGNGRISRLLTHLALEQLGYEVGRYVSLERLIEESREDYYDVLHRSSEDWHEGRHDLLPWLNYFLATLRRAWFELEQQVGFTPGGAPG